VSIFAAVKSEELMQRCIQLALNGAGTAAPNPMVGAVLVQGDRILAEGWHRAVGGPHAEVECLKAFGDGPVPDDAVMYVNLEPCAHHGRTPPCADLLIARGVRTVIVGCEDPNPLVKGQGVARMRDAGVHVTVGVCEAKSRWLNRRFITSIEQQRPYVVLKWAASADGYLDDHGRTARISSAATDVLVHRWRSEEQAIMVGSRTVINDDPQLTVRHVEGRQPLRVVIDRGNTAPAAARVFDGAAPTLLITCTHRPDIACDQLVIGPSDDPIDRLMSELHKRNIRSLMVEGGASLLTRFIDSGRWDEARVIQGTAVFGAGTRAPKLIADPAAQRKSGTDTITLHVRGISPPLPCSW
jgi:diaminohydroxyphosphoribosylaminopyrimidine deaminase/5-amino-6-(5-phosphoribosylamino)uracil reductase